VIATSLIDAALAAAPVYIDFTTPNATAAIAVHARQRRIAAVVGTTGLTQAASARSTSWPRSRRWSARPTSRSA
jgi:dihydrodipicolinate reductase